MHTDSGSEQRNRLDHACVQQVLSLLSPCLGFVSLLAWKLKCVCIPLRDLARRTCRCSRYGAVRLWIFDAQHDRRAMFWGRPRHHPLWDHVHVCAWWLSPQVSACPPMCAWLGASLASSWWKRRLTVNNPVPAVCYLHVSLIQPSLRLKHLLWDWLKCPCK